MSLMDKIFAKKYEVTKVVDDTDLSQYYENYYGPLYGGSLTKRLNDQHPPQQQYQPYIDHEDYEDYVVRAKMKRDAAMLHYQKYYSQQVSINPLPPMPVQIFSRVKYIQKDGSTRVDYYDSKGVCKAYEILPPTLQDCL